MEQIADVLVVGAGISGLSCAHRLVAADRTVAVIEARPEVGGRLRTVRNATGASFDLGATWFWPGEQRVAASIERHGIATHSQYLDGDAMYHDPAGSRRIDGNPLDVPSGRFSDGAHTLAAAVAAALPAGTVATATTVEGIEVLDEERLAVRTSSGDLAARHVVLAVPPALAVASIDFSPGLPERIAGLAAATPVWMGAVAKVVMIFAEPFWRAAGLAGAAISHFGPMRELHDMSGPGGEPAALFGFAHVGPSGPPTPAAVDQQLVELFGPDAPKPTDVRVMNWADERWTSPAGVERLTAYQLFGHEHFQRPVLGGHLHWASTETATESPGHIEGALQAAERATNQILAAS